MSEEVKAGDVTSGKDLVVTSGVGLAIIGESIGSAFLPSLRADMPLDERKTAIRDIIKQSLTVDDRIGIVQGEMLYEVYTNDYWKGYTYEDKSSGDYKNYSDFNEYVEIELGWKPRKSKYLISIYKRFVVELGIPTEVLRDMEWSKAKELVNVINSDNWQDLLEQIKTMTVPQVIELAKALAGSSKSSTGTRAAKEPTSSVGKKFNLTSEQAENVEAALKAASALTGSEKDGHNLDLICTDFLAGMTGAEGGMEAVLGRIDFIIANLTRTYGVTLEVKHVDTSRYTK